MGKAIQRDIYLGLGSNLGDSRANIYSAIAELKQNPALRIIESSDIYTTEALSRETQPDYKNAAIKIETSLDANELLILTQMIEKKMGRTEKGTNASRIIDIDILFYGNEIICEDELTIPHPLAHEREFVLMPLMDIAKHFEHPALGETISEIYECMAI